MFGIRCCAGKSRGVRVLRSAAYGNHPDVIVKLADAGVLNTGDRVDHRCPVWLIVPVGSDAFVKLAWEHAAERALVRSLSLACCPRRCFHKIATVRLLVDADVDTTLAFTEGQVLCGTPMAIAEASLGTKTIGGEPATDEQLHGLEAVRRMFLQKEAVHATSWLWLGVVHVASQSRAEKALTASTTALLPTNWRRYGTSVLLPAIFR